MYICFTEVSSGTRIITHVYGVTFTFDLRSVRKQIKEHINELDEVNAPEVIRAAKQSIETIINDGDMGLPSALIDRVEEALSERHSDVVRKRFEALWCFRHVVAVVANKAVSHVHFEPDLNVAMNWSKQDSGDHLCLPAALRKLDTIEGLALMNELQEWFDANVDALM